MTRPLPEVMSKWHVSDVPSSTSIGKGCAFLGWGFLKLREHVLGEDILRTLPHEHYLIFEAGGHGAGVKLGRNILTTSVLVQSP